MSFTTALWYADGDQLLLATRSSLQSERQLEIWLEKDPSVLGRELLIIGRQVRTPGGPLDLLALDEDGELIILELKRDKTPREVVAQTLDYASWVRTLEYPQIDGLCQQYLRRPLTTAFQEKFQTALPETVGTRHSMLIVASALDDSFERIIEYLQEEHGININVLFFSVFEIDGKTMIARSWLASPEQTKERVEQKHKVPWSGIWFVNDGAHDKNGRSWEACVKFGFVTAGGGSNWSDQLGRLKSGDQIVAYEKGRGYVGYGIVTQTVMAASEFKLPNGKILTDEVEKFNREKGLRTFDSSRGNPERCEYAIGVEWKATVGPEEQGKWFTGAFAKMHVVCRLRDQRTVEFLSKEFKIPPSNVNPAES